MSRRFVYVVVLLAACAVSVSATVGWSNGRFGDGGYGGPPMAATWLADMAYFGGGEAGGLPSQLVLAYNGATHQWTNWTAALNPARVYVGAAVVGRKVIFAGGHNYVGVYSAAVDMYDVDTGVWTNVPNALNTPRDVNLACSNGAKTKAIFWGGGISGSSSQQPDVYDGTNWSPVTLPSNYIGRTMTYRAQNGGPAGANHCVFVGGLDLNNAALPTADIFDFNTGTLRSNVSGLTVARRFFATASYSNRVLFAGGRDSATGTFLDSIEYYDAGTDSWGLLPVSLSVARVDLQAVATPFGNLVFFCGGSTASNTVAVVDMYNISSGAMTLSRPLASSQYGFSAAVAGSQVLTAGGYDGNDVECSETNVYESSYCAGSSNPCLNGGTCVSGLTGFSCACPAPYVGPTYLPAVTGVSTAAATGGLTAGGATAAAGSTAAAGTASTATSSQMSRGAVALTAGLIVACILLS